MSSVDVFGRYLFRSKQSIRGSPGVGYKLTSDGQYDVEQKRICNIADPQQNTDAASLNSVHKVIANYDLKVKDALKHDYNTLAGSIQNQDYKISDLRHDYEFLENLVDSIKTTLIKKDIQLESSITVLDTGFATLKSTIAKLRPKIQKPKQTVAPESQS